MSRKIFGRYSCLGVGAWLLLLILAGIASASYPEPKESDVNIQGSVWHWVPVNIVQDDNGWYPGYKIDKDGEFLTMDTPFDSRAYIEKDFDVPLSETSNLYLEVWGARNIGGRCGSPVNVEITVIDSKSNTILDNFVPVQRDYNVGPGEPKHYGTSIFAGQRVKIRIYQSSSYKFCAFGNYKNVNLFAPTPIADFKVNKTSEMMPQIVKFTDSSIGAISWEWDFNNDGIIDSIDRNPSYIYAKTGTYIVSLKVRGPIGSPSQMKKYILIDVIDNRAQVLEIPIPSDIVFYLRGEPNMKVAEERSITLSVTNLITNPSMKAQLFLRIPPEMEVHSSEFSKTGVGGEFSSVEYDVKPGDGDSRHITVGVKPYQEGSFNITGWILYYFAGNKTDIKRETRTLNVKVNNAIGEPVKNQKETKSEQSIIYQERLPVYMPTVSTPKVPDFDAALAIVILSTVYLIRRKQ